jgi:hypothetical protein
VIHNFLIGLISFSSLRMKPELLEAVHLMKKGRAFEADI